MIDLNFVKNKLQEGLTQKEIANLLGVNPKVISYHLIKNNIIEKFGRGKNPSSNKKRVYDINDNFFGIPNLINSYFAGWIAADGNISDKKYLNLTTCLKDKILIENFKEFAKCNYNIHTYKVKNKFYSSSISIRSEKICDDLNNLFNITPRKSVTLLPPIIKEIDLIDSFIIGYIDGDGSIGLYKCKKQLGLSISLLGTLEIVTWIQNRFSEILQENINCIYKDAKHIGNTYSLSITDKRARKIFLHYYNINVPKLKRKWSLDNYEHCIKFKKYENLEKYNNILILEKEGMTQKQIAKNIGISQAAVSWYQRRETYKKLKMESDLQEQDVSNIEDEQNLEQDA